MNRTELLNILRKHKPILKERFGVTELTLFGSFARDQATETSDIDIIVKFNGPATSKGYFGTISYLEEQLGRTVDLATHKSLRPEILPFVEKDTKMAEKHKLVREWRFHVKDMIKFGEEALSYTDGMNKAALAADGLTYNATLHVIQLIGEAATHIPEDVKEAYPDIPWDEIIGTRNRIVHGYDVVNEDVIWNIIQTDLPTLIPQLEKILEDAQEEQP